VRTTPSAQQLCKDAGIPTYAAAHQAYCQKLVLSATERAQGKVGMAPAQAAAETIKKLGQPPAPVAAGQPIKISTTGENVREGRRSVIYPACQQAGVAQDSLEACYQAIKQGQTASAQVTILQNIATQMQAAASQLQTGAQLPTGTIHYQDATGVFHVAVPVGTTLGGFGQADHIEAGTTTVDPTPAGSTPVTKAAYDMATGAASASLLKKWWFWAAAVGGLALIGSGVVMFRRRRHG